MTPPWLRPFNYSDRLTLNLPDDAQMGAQGRRFPRPTRRPVQTVPATQPAAPVATTPDPQAAAPAAAAPASTQDQYQLIPGTDLSLRVGERSSSNPVEETCNFTRRIQDTPYRLAGDTEDRHVRRLISAEPRPGIRLCSVGGSVSWSDYGIDAAFRAAGLGILNGPERSLAGTAQLDVHLGQGILGFLRLSGGSLRTDGASFLNGAPMSSDTSPAVEGGWGAIGAGLTHLDAQRGSPVEVSNLLRVGLQMGFTHTSVQNPASGTSDEGRSNFRFSIFREGDFSLNFPLGNRGRLTLDLLPAVVNLTTPGYTDPLCRGLFCSAGDLLHHSPFIPLSVRLDIYPNSAPSTGSDQWTRFGQNRPITTEEFLYYSMSRVAGEAINFGRGLSVHQFIGLQAMMGTEGAGTGASRDLYGTAGVGQFALASFRGMGRASDVFRQGDILRNTYGTNSSRFWTTVALEAGILLIEGAVMAANSGSWTSQDFLNCLDSRSSTSSACENNPYANPVASSMRLNFLENLAYGGLLAVEASDILGSPRRGGGVFWASSLGSMALGLTGIFTANLIAGFPSGNGLTGDSMIGDGSPFFRGVYDPIDDNFLGRAQTANFVTSTGAMLTTWGAMRLIRHLSHNAEREETVLNAASPRTPAGPGASSPAQTSSASGTGVRLRSVAVNVLPNGLSASANLEF